MKRFVGIIVPLIVITLGTAACGSSDNTGTLASNGTPSSGTTTAAPAKHFKKGDTVEVGKTWRVIINDVISSLGTDMSKPSKGAYLIIDISLTNISNKEQNISSMMNFTLKGPDKTRYTETMTFDMPNINAAPNGKVTAGDGIKGHLVYDVPADVKAFTFYFEASLISSGQTIWDINL